MWTLGPSTKYVLLKLWQSQHSIKYSDKLLQSERLHQNSKALIWQQQALQDLKQDKEILAEKSIIEYNHGLPASNSFHK